MTFSEKLVQIRRHHELSQEDLAEKLYVSRHSVSRWETGHSMPDIKTVLLISEVFTVSIDYLLNDSMDDLTGKLMDYRTLKIAFWASAALIFGGLVLSFLGWSGNGNFKLIIIGLILGVFGCVCFEVFYSRNIDTVLVRYVRRQFYSINVWILLPAPFYVGMELIVSAERMQPLMPYLLGLAVYMVVAATITIVLMYKFRR